MRHEELFTCLYCGKEFLARRKEAKYCCWKCSNLSKTKNHKKPARAKLTKSEIANGIFICPHNDGVRCSMCLCKTCGWNPAVALKRKEALYEGV